MGLAALPMATACSDAVWEPEDAWARLGHATGRAGTHAGLPGAEIERHQRHERQDSTVPQGRANP